MAQPTDYTRQHDFSSELGTAHGTNLDGEFDAVKLSLDETLTNLARIQRDDGRLRNQSVHPDTFTTASLALMGNLNPRGLWVTATSYAVRDIVEQGGVSYVCGTAHTSSTFAAARTLGYWTVMGADAVVRVTSLAALMAQPIPTSAGMMAFNAYRSTAGDGAGGPWEWLDSNQEANVTADPLHGIYAPPDADPTGASGAWKRVYEKIRGLWFGAVGDGTTDDATAIQAAITYVASLGKWLVWDKRTYLIGTALTIPSGALIDWGGATVKRKAGSINGGAATQMMKATSISGLKMKNLIIDGNKDANSLVAGTSAHRFGGLVLDTVTSSRLENIAVTGTVNAEDTAGIYLTACTDVDLINCDGYSNDRSAIYFTGCDRITIRGSLTYSNLGSGVTSSDSDDCGYYDLISHDNDYSCVSISGLRCKGDNIHVYNGQSAYAGLNIGHDAASNRGDYSIITNVHAHDCAGWGITVVGSAGVQLRGIDVYNNATQGVYVFSNSTKCIIDGATVRSTTTGNGIYINSGTGHKISNAEVFSNATSGINIGTSVAVDIDSSVRCYNNGAVTSANSAGIILNAATNCRVEAECFDDQGTPTQESGLWLAGGSGHRIVNAYIHDNKTNNYRETSSPTGVSIQGLKIGTDVLHGTFTATGASTTTTVTNNNASAVSKIKVWATNAAAVTLGSPFVSSVTVGTSFVVTFPGAAAGTETFAYQIE